MTWDSPKPTKVKNKKKSAKVEFLKVPSFSTMLRQVTVKDYKEFLEKYPEWKKENISELYSDSYYLKSLPEAKDNQPITFVSWFAARAYCHSFGMRLPTIQEWEYMAEASEKKPKASKNPRFLKRILEWYGEPQGSGLKPVQSIYKNYYGVWDLHGLVWEWVEDFNSSFVTGESREDGSLNKDMFCGAGTLAGSDKENYASYMRFAFRSGLTGKSSIWNLGFRCVK